MGDAVLFAVADLLNLQVDVLFFDTTSTYIQRYTEEPSSEQVPAGGLRWGEALPGQRLDLGRRS